MKKTLADLFKLWKEMGAPVRTKDGREIPMRQLWEEVFDNGSTDWAEIYGEKAQDERSI